MIVMPIRTGDRIRITRLGNWGNGSNHGFYVNDIVKVIAITVHPNIHTQIHCAKDGKKYMWYVYAHEAELAYPLVEILP